MQSGCPAPVAVTSPVPAPPAVELARTVVATLIELGVAEAVLAPGSRNAPLSIALHEADQAGLIRLHVRIDERTAGFLAVGIGRASGRPAVVATTSGTAVANLHPAVLEAHHGGVPMLVLSADRPPALRALGANQVIDQQQVFTPALRHFVEIDTPTTDSDPAQWRRIIREAAAKAIGSTDQPGLPGPVQLNLPMAEPLLPNPDDEPGGWLRGLATPAWNHQQPSGETADAVPAPEPGERVLFVADLTHPAAGPVAAAGHPVIAEAGGAAGALVLAAGIDVLATGFVESVPPDRVIVLGRPTLYRSVAALLRTAPVVDVVGPTGPVADPTGRARLVRRGLAPITTAADPEFRARWERANAAATSAIGRRLAEADLSCTPRLAAEVAAALPADTTLVLGSSQLPRDLGRFSAARDGVTIVANRGVAGIDGTVSTALGVALASDRRTVALMGDLTFLHDLNGLLIGPHEPRPDLDIVVANNDGGAIFAALEPGEPAYARSFERVFGTPHGVDLGPAVGALGVEHLLVTDPGQLADELAAPQGIRVLEVPATRTDLRGWLADTERAVRQAIAGG